MGHHDKKTHIYEIRIYDAVFTYARMNELRYSVKMVNWKIIFIFWVRTVSSVCYLNRNILFPQWSDFNAV